MAQSIKPLSTSKQTTLLPITPHGLSENGRIPQGGVSSQRITSPKNIKSPIVSSEYNNISQVPRDIENNDERDIEKEDITKPVGVEINESEKNRPITKQLVIVFPNAPNNNGSKMIQNTGNKKDTYDFQLGNDVRFKIDFPCAGTFCQLVNLITGTINKSTNVHNYFEISPGGITYKGVDSTNSVLYHSELYAYNMVSFDIVPPITYRMFLPLLELKKKAKGYRQGMNLSMIKNKGSSRIFITPDINDISGSGDQLQYLDQINMETPREFIVPTIDCNNENPNAVITSSKFKSICKSITNKQSVQIIGCKSMVTFAQIEGGPGGGSIWRYQSNVIRPDDKQILTGKIMGCVMRNLTSLCDFSPHGIVKFYFQEERQNDYGKIQPPTVKISVPIGHAGKQDIYITPS